jgi:hypothetical protein
MIWARLSMGKLERGVPFHGVCGALTPDPNAALQAVANLALERGVPFHGVCGALIAMREVSRGFEFQQQSKAEVMDKYFAATFDALMALGKAALDAPAESKESAIVVKYITKILWSSTTTPIRSAEAGVPDYLLKAGNQEAWLEFLALVMERQVPEIAQDGPEVDKEYARVLWKPKRWAAQVIISPSLGSSV